MKIGELAKFTGLTASRIRFYEAAGLIGTIERGANGYRRYPPDALWKFEIIVTAQRAGFSLDQIRHLLPMDARGWQHTELVETLKKKVAEISAMQKQLARNKAQLNVAIKSIQGRPKGLDCSENIKRVLDLLRVKPGKSANRR